MQTIVYWRRQPSARSAYAVGIAATLERERRSEQLFPPPRLIAGVGSALDETSRRLAQIRLVTASDAETADIVAALGEDPSVELAHVAPPRLLYTRRPAVQSLPTKHLDIQWRAAVRLTNAQSGGSWSTPDATRVSVGIVDSGVDQSHPALSHVQQIEYLAAQPTADPIGHGTHVAGIIAAKDVSGWSHVGIASDIADVTMHRGLGAPHEPSAYYRALRSAIETSRIVNLSLGGPDEDPTEQLIIQLAGPKTVVVAAMGNEFAEGNPTCFPAAIDGVIAVAAVDNNGQWCDFSCTGPHVCIAAPGLNVGSTVPTYAVAHINSIGTPPGSNLSGTSMATPIVTATIAKILSLRPHYTVHDVKQSLCVSTPGLSEEVGMGMLDIEATLARVRT